MQTEEPKGGTQMQELKGGTQKLEEAQGNVVYIQVVSLPDQRVLAEGLHSDAFIPHEERMQGVFS